MTRKSPAHTDRLVTRWILARHQPGPRLPDHRADSVQLGQFATRPPAEMAVRDSVRPGIPAGRREPW